MRSTPGWARTSRPPGSGTGPAAASWPGSEAKARATTAENAVADLQANLTVALGLTPDPTNHPATLAAQAAKELTDTRADPAAQKRENAIGTTAAGDAFPGAPALPHPPPDAAAVQTGSATRPAPRCPIPLGRLRFPEIHAQTRPRSALRTGSRHGADRASTDGSETEEH